MLKRLFLAILSKLYITGVKFRHFLFNSEILKSESFDIPIICVGNITVGGTGKTPMCELLIEHFSQQGHIALLSRGYGRKSRGYREVKTTDSYKESGDEPLQMKMKYPETLVVVCEKRVDAVRRIIKEHPDVSLIIMDDGFQHRHIAPRINIIMCDYTRPIEEDHPLPLGSLRDTPEELHRANYLIVTKCPKRLRPLDIGLATKGLNPTPTQQVMFTHIASLAPTPLFKEYATAELTKRQEVISLSGIGNPAPFTRRVAADYKLVKEMIYPDHHSYTKSDIKAIAKQLEEHPSAMLITTEKDGVKMLRNNDIPNIIKERTYYIPIEMGFITGSKFELLNKIEKDVR